MKQINYSIGVVMLLLLLFNTIAIAKEIVITTPGRQTIPLAHAPLLATSAEDNALAQTFHDVLQGDLDLSGLFEFVDEGAFLDDAKNDDLNSSDINFAQWRMLGAQVLLKGTYKLRRNKLELKVRLFDVMTRRLLIGHNYQGQAHEIRRMAHSFADQVMKVLTGKLGSFNTRIAFISDRTGNKELYLCESDGYGSQRVTNHANLILNPDFSPLGHELIFTSYHQGNPDLYRKEIYTGREVKISSQIGLDGRVHKRMTNAWGIDVDPTWNPIGDQLAFVSDRQGNPHIFIVDVLSGQTHRLTHAGRYNATPAWSPDGKRIVFSRLEGGVFNLFSIDPDGFDERQLTFGAGNKEHPRWSPDSRFIAYSNDISGNKAICVMRADGSGQRQISTIQGNCSHPAWSKSW
ncbi:MAG: Tol-Pal system beta propeller repeat protein TolB [Desulfobacteraceae bacterium 4572_35.1]|nr:MAG: Tol-Pal system beta propeller repeat protein TolB [Desulfobacteraceae bacterium 4572_35.1]